MSNAFSGITGALGNRNYAIYTAGNATSLIGLWVQRVAIGYLMWELTHSYAWLGTLALVDLAPTVLLGPIAGAAADRWNRIRLTQVCQSLAMVQATVMAVLTAGGYMTPGLLLALTLFVGCVMAVNQPARLGLVPSLVTKPHLPSAIALNSLIFNGARVLGPGIAGAIIYWSDVSTAFAFNAVTFLGFLLALSRLRLDPEPKRAPSGSTMFGEMVEAIHYVRRHAGIGPSLVLLGIASVLVRSLAELLPGIADTVFGGDERMLATLMSSLGAGAIVGGLWLAMRKGPAGLSRVMLMSVFAMAGASLLFVSTDMVWVAIPAIALLGAAMVCGGVATQTLIQISVDGGMRGRVLGFYGMIFRGGPAVGALLLGQVAEFTGPRIVLACGAAGTIAAAVWIGRQHRRISEALETIETPAPPAAPHAARPAAPENPGAETEPEQTSTGPKQNS